MNQRASAPYLGFTADTPPEHARWVFAERFGQQPEECFVDGTALLVGPLPETDKLGRKREPQPALA